MLLILGVIVKMLRGFGKDMRPPEPPTLTAKTFSLVFTDVSLRDKRRRNVLTF